MASEAFITALKATKQISLTVKGRKTGKAVTLPIWYGMEGQILYIMPKDGSRTNWYRNLPANPTITLKAGPEELSASYTRTTEKPIVQKVIGMIRERHGEDGLKHYSGFDAAVVVDLR